MKQTTEVKWIKIVTDVFDNRKIRMIEAMPDGDALIVIWFKLLTLAGQVNEGGMLVITADIPYTEQLLANQFGRPISTVQLALRTFEQLGMIEVVDDIIRVSNWERYQNVDGMDKIREQTRNRVAKYRENKRLEACNVTSNATVTQCNADRIENKNKDIQEETIANAIAKKKFTPPTVEEVTAYCTEQGFNIDPNTFIDFYESKNWMVGANKMKDWKAACRNWNRRAKDNPNRNTDSRPKTSFHQMEERNSSYSTLFPSLYD